MGYRIKIYFSSNPTNQPGFEFTITNAAIGYSNYIYKTFVYGTPVNPLNQVQGGVTRTETLLRLLNNLNAYNTDSEISYSLINESGIPNEFTTLILDFVTDGTYTVVLTIDPGYLAFTSLTYITPVPVAMDPLVWKDLSIEIIDTYTNTMSLVEEFTKENAPKMTWEAGDDMYETLMASKLTFNMLVADKADAKFGHLFTGDEQRYRVELYGIDVLNVKMLIWQGFLLPDLYSEPYTNEAFFPEFTAVDMIASLKGKYFDPWYYQNSFPISQLLAFILQKTGLNQNLLVKPSVVPENAPWSSINVPLRTYAKDDKFKDVYTILIDVLKAQGLTLSSFRGYWFLEGITRKKDVSGTMHQFDVDGVPLTDMLFVKNEKYNMLSRDVPVISGVTPWKSVNVAFDTDGTKNLFSEEVIKLKDLFATNYRNDDVAFTSSPPGVAVGVSYFHKIFRDWIININSDFQYYYSDLRKQLMWRRNPAAGTSGSYHYTEAMALANYFECPENPVLKPEVNYELELGFRIKSISAGNSDTFKSNLNEGRYDKIFPFQLFLDGTEILSNRPSFPDSSRIRYEVADNETLSTWHEVTFKLKHEFKVSTEGLAKFRVLMPIIDLTTDTADSIGFMYGEVLKLNILEDYDITESVRAERSINYTKELNFETKFNSTADLSVINNFGLGTPLNTDYFYEIPRTLNFVSDFGHHYFAPVTDLLLTLPSWQITAGLEKLLFADGVSNATFLEKTTGEKVPFCSLYTQKRNGINRMCYLEDYTGHPVIPKKYHTNLGVVAGDILKYMLVLYAVEDVVQRYNWKMYGSVNVDVYNRILANALHAVCPEPLYKLEANAMDLLFPDDLVQFYYVGLNRNFIPTRLVLDLFHGQTTFTATEAKFTELTDITYE